MVGHNVGFDLGILRSELRRLSLPEARYSAWFDTLDLSRRFCPQLPNHKLETLSTYFGTETRSSHDAMEDILATGEVLIRILQDKLMPLWEKRREIYRAYAPRFEKLSAGLGRLRQDSLTKSCSEMVREVIHTANLKGIYARFPEKLAHLTELETMAHEMEPQGAPEGIFSLLRTASLSSGNLDRLAGNGRIPILTVHQAKGAQFDAVFLAGLQEGVFPTFYALESGEIDEEKRIFYVAITRARFRLFLSCALSVEGKERRPSRFLKDIPMEYCIQETAGLPESSCSAIP